MAGIYIHIPFCRKACHYCNFHFSTSAKNITEMVEAIVKEAEIRSNYLDENIETIYFGGGTPSLLSLREVELLLHSLRKIYTVTPAAEVTLEANPDDITASKLEEWKGAGINRLSIGVQSFFDEDLEWMNRAHNASQVITCLEMALKQFDNITIDLIYGTPTLTDQHWRENVHIATQLGIPHLSCYALTVEPKTALDKMITLKKKEPVDPAKQAHHFELLMDWLAVTGYEHYEISNFAKPGYHSRHNSSYWQGKPYLGLGPSAHSYNLSEREWNVSNNALYLKSIQQGVVPAEKEVLTATQRLNEYIMTSIRLSGGLSLKLIQEKWSADARLSVEKEAEAFLHQNHIRVEKDHLILTNSGKLFADGIAAKLFQ